MFRTKDELMDLLDGRTEMLPLIHDALAEHHITDASYSDIFQLLYSSHLTPPSQTVSYSAASKEWKMGKKVLSDVKVFGLLSKVCDIIRYYVRSSWEECIFSAWMDDSELEKTEKDMDNMESLSHVRAILKLASSSMTSSDDVKMDWSDSDSSEE